MPNPLSQFGLTDLELNAAVAQHAEKIGALKAKADEIADHWKGIAPVFGDRPPKREAPPYGGAEGEYRDSIRAEPFRKKDGMPAYRVGTDDYRALWIELGTKHMPEYAPATKTAALFGDTTGPIMSEGVKTAQGHLREQLETLAKLKAEGAAASRIAEQTKQVNAARQARTSAFKAARGRRRGRRR